MHMEKQGGGGGRGNTMNMRGGRGRGRGRGGGRGRGRGRGRGGGPGNFGMNAGGPRSQNARKDVKLTDRQKLLVGKWFDHKSKKGFNVRVDMHAKGGATSLIV